MASGSYVTTSFVYFRFMRYIKGNISGRNQPLRANYGNFNLSHRMLIQGKTYRRWEGWCVKFMRGGRDDLQTHFCKSPLPPPMSPPLDQYHVAQIEVSIVCMEMLVSTWYVPYIKMSRFFLFCCPEISAILRLKLLLQVNSWMHCNLWNITY
jgi:hypothetical protein